MVRKFVTLDGEVLAEEEWEIKPMNICFYCDMPLTEVQIYPMCSGSQNKGHDWITLVNPTSPTMGRSIQGM